MKPTDRKAITEFPTRHLSRKQHWAPKLDRVPFPLSLPGRKGLVLSIAEGLALGFWGRLMLRHEFIILVGGVPVLPRAARAQLAIPVIGFLGSALQSVSNYLAAFRNRIRTIPRSFGGNAMHATLDCLTAMAACTCSPPAPLSRAPRHRSSRSHRPLPTSFGTSMVQAGRHGRSNRTGPFGEKW